MNAINLIQTINPQIRQTKLSQTSEAAEQNSFLKLLDHALTEGEISTAQLSGELGQDDLTSLHNLITSLVEDLSLMETAIEKEDLTIPFIEDFLNELPSEFQLELEQLFTNNATLMDIIDDGEGYLQNPVQLLAVILNLAKLDEQVQSSVILSDQHHQLASALKSQLEKILPNLFSGQQYLVNNEQMSDIKLQNFVQQLTTNLQRLSDHEKRGLNEALVKFKQGADRKDLVLTAFTRATTEKLTSVTQGINFSSSNQHIPQLQQFVLHVGEGQANLQTSEQFLKQFQNILGRSSLVQYPNGINQLSIKLFPEHLGRLEVKLTQQNGVIVAQLLTTTQTAKKAIDSQLQQLKQAFIAQNIQVEKIEINTVQQQQLFNESDKQSQQEQSNDQQNSDHREHETPEEEASFQDFLEETINLKA